MPVSNFKFMSKEKRSAIARMGGLAAHAKGVAHKFTPEEAKIAGARGGMTIGDSKARYHQGHAFIDHVLPKFMTIATPEEKITYRQLMKYYLDEEARRYVRIIVKRGDI